MTPTSLRTLLGSANAWLVAASVFLTGVVAELAPYVDVHPAIKTVVGVLAAAVVWLGVAAKIVARSTEVPPRMQGLGPVNVDTQSWIGPDGGRYTYASPGSTPTAGGTGSFNRGGPL